MSDRSQKLKRISAKNLKRKQQEAKQAYDNLMDEVSVHHRVKRIMFDSEMKDRLYKKSNGICVWCKRPLEYDEAVLDHIFPLARGGTNDESNLQVLHLSCNQSKGASLEHLSREEQIGYLKKRFDEYDEAH